MKKKPTARAKKESAPSLRLSPVFREAALLVFAALATYLLIAMISYHPDDPSWTDTGQGETRNAAGQVGAFVADILLHLLGNIAYLIPFMLGYHGWLLYSMKETANKERGTSWRATLIGWGGFFMTLASTCSLASIYLASSLPAGSGGWIGRRVAWAFVETFSEAGATVFLLAFLLIGISVWTGFSWLKLVDQVGKSALQAYDMAGRAVEWTRGYFEGRQKLQERKRKRQQKREKKQEAVVQGEGLRIQPKGPVVIDLNGKRKAQEKQRKLFKTLSSKELPPLDLLDEPVEGTHGYSEDALRNMSKQIEIKLEEFKIDVAVVEVIPGPIVTRFDLEPGPGVRGSKISSYAKDLARSLSVDSVRVEEVVQGKPVIGLEVPNEDREMVMTGEILRSKTFSQSNFQLPLALGKSINGEPIVCDLAKMPHLLVAGATGSGKSVAVNTMIMSLLYKAPPMDLRLILIDPKLIELGAYEGIPHLLTPVVKTPGDAAQALLWCVAEMERRYTIMSKLGVRNLSGYNHKIAEAEKAKTPLQDPAYESSSEGDEAPTLQHMPCIVVVIDEFADLVMTSGKKVEECIIRLAQKARAAGIHLMLGTQRPTREVITGLIKANIPSRISFNVRSNIDSRTILDQVGAESLLGHGDMLFLNTGETVPMRVHGGFISNDEVHKVTQHLREHGGDPDYLEEITQKDAPISVAGITGDDEDEAEGPMYQEAIDIVLRDRKASISYLQRRLRVGYNRAARLIEKMEEDQIVGAPQSNGAREILLPPPEES